MFSFISNPKVHSARLRLTSKLCRTARPTRTDAAPELIRRILDGGKRSTSPELTTAIDCWSLGVVLYLSLCGRFPFRVRENTITPNFKRQNQGGVVSFTDPVWATVSNAAKSVILGLLTVDPEKRLTAIDVLQHPWVRDIANARADSRAGTMMPEAVPGLAPERPESPLFAEGGAAVDAEAELELARIIAEEVPPPSPSPLPALASPFEHVEASEEPR